VTVGISTNNILLGGLTATVSATYELGSASLLGLTLMGSGCLFRRRFGKEA
jgi:hypothetical protein